MTQTPASVVISQSVAILVDGNNMERSIHTETGSTNTMLNYDTLVPKLLDNRGLNRLVYFARASRYPRSSGSVCTPITTARCAPATRAPTSP